MPGFEAKDSASDRLLDARNSQPAPARTDAAAWFSGLVREKRVAIANGDLLIAVAFIFLLPNAIFATALRPAPAALILIGLRGAVAALLWRAPRGGARCSLRRSILRPTPDVSLRPMRSVMLGGEGHFFYASAGLADTRRRARRSRQERLHGSLSIGESGLSAARAARHVCDSGHRRPRFRASMPRIWRFLRKMPSSSATIAYFVAQLSKVRGSPMLLLFFAFSGSDIVRRF